MKIFLKVSNFICSLGCALTYITLSKDLWMVAATYGFVSAFGQNIALIPTLTTAMKWFPNRKGKCIQSYDTVFKCSQFLALIMGRSQTTFTRGGGYVVKKNQLFVNFYTIENVKGGG